MQQAPGAETAPITATELPPLSRDNWPFRTFEGRPLPELQPKRQRKAPPAYPTAPDAPF